jgi:hypothetical protein
MNAGTLLAELRARRVVITSLGTDLLIDAPNGALTDELRAAIVTHKTQLLGELNTSRTRAPQSPPSALVGYAADRLPVIRMTYRETRDLAHDFTVLDTLRDVIAQYEPGGNRVRLRLVTADGRRFLLEWRALADGDLRLDLARVLASEGVRRASTR